jgi:hypothetical protein
MTLGPSGCRDDGASSGTAWDALSVSGVFMAWGDDGARNGTA